MQAKSEETEVLSIPLPSLVDGESDGTKFRQEVREDSSLKKLREWADRQENDYCWKDGLLKHMIDGDVGEVWERVVVPVRRWKLILKLAHSVPTAGHMCDKKTRALLKRYYTWLCISRVVKEWCTTCSKCQIIKKSPPRKVPLHLPPVISTPFEVMAFDLVGPFDRSQNGYKFILTSI